MPPLSIFHHTAIQALANNATGVRFPAKNAQGELQHFSESQLVADILKAYHEASQVVLGEAICSKDLLYLLQNSPAILY